MNQHPSEIPAPSAGRPPGRPRDERRTSQRRDAILRSAVKNFARSGYQNCDLEDVARDIGCAKGTLYRYFPTKRELFAAATDLIMRELLERVSTAPPPASVPHGSDLLGHAVREFLRFFDEHPEYVELIVQERVELKDRPQSTYFQYRAAHAPAWAAHFQSLIDAGRLRPMPAMRPFQVVGDLLYGAIFTKYFSRSDVPLSDRAEDILDIIYHGILAADQPQRSGESPCPSPPEPPEGVPRGHG